MSSALSRSISTMQDCWASKVLRVWKDCNIPDPQTMSFFSFSYVGKIFLLHPLAKTLPKEWFNTKSMGKQSRANVGRLCTWLHMACTCLPQTGLNKELGNTENDNDAMTASQLPLWLASCLPPVSQCSFCLNLAPTCSHPFLVCFHLPQFIPLPVFNLALEWFFSGSKIKLGERREWRLSGYVSGLKIPPYDVSGSYEPSIKSPV